MLAQKVLAGKTKGYRNHPQLERFKTHPFPQKAVGRYLLEVWNEASRRGYAFDGKKVKDARKPVPAIPVSRGQLRYEWEHLRKKLRRRDPLRWKASKKNQRVLPHPGFKLVPGGVAVWERTRKFH